MIKLHYLLFLCCLWGAWLPHASLAQNAAPAQNSTDNQNVNSVQIQYLKTITHASQNLWDSVDDLLIRLNEAVPPLDNELHRLFILNDSYDKNPRVLEAINHNIINVADSLEIVMTPAQEALTTAQGLLARVIQLEKTLPETTGKRAQHVIMIKSQLSESIQHLQHALAHPQDIIDKARKETTLNEVDLPILWQKEYLTLSWNISYGELWGDMPLKLQEMSHHFRLRLDREIPSTIDAWLFVGLRFVTLLFFGGIVSLVAYHRWYTQPAQTPGETAIPRSVFYTSVPWLVCGIALLGASLASGHVYQGLLTLGNVLLIIGQISLAWELRRTQCPACSANSPFWPMCVTALLGYILLYPGLPIALLALVWVLIVLLALLWQRKRVPVHLYIENTVVHANTVVLWLSLFLLCIGLPHLAIILYIMFTSLVAALQLGIGGMHALHVAAQRLPKEGMKAVLGSIWLACMAPCMILLIVLGMALWVITLQGGYSLLHTYALTGLDIAGTHFNILQLLLIISLFYITRTVVHIGSGLLGKIPERGIDIDASLIPPMQTAFTYGTWTLFCLLCLKFLGMELSNLAVVAGGLSVGIGFGMQNIVNNFLSGMILIFSRVLQEGDVVDVGGLVGTVRKISVRATTVETADNAVIYVPNAEFVSNRLINWTRNSRNVRREITIGVAYGTDTELVSTLLCNIAQMRHDVLKKPKPTVLFSDFGNSTLDFTLRFWVHDIDDAKEIASHLRHAIEKAFREHGIEISFNQLDVHIKEMPSAPKAME